MATKTQSNKVTVQTKQRSTALTTPTSLAEAAKKLKERIDTSGADKIKFDNGQFVLPSGAKAEELDIVILDFVHFNAFYDSVYVEGVVSAPKCYAIHPNPTELAPYENSPRAVSEQCKGCPNNEFGTASNGKGKACGNRILAAVVPADATPTTPPAILDIPPTGIKGFQKYVQTVADAWNVPPFAVVTHVSRDDSVRWDVPLFSDPQMLNEDQIEVMSQLLDKARERLERPINIEAIEAMAASKAPPARGGLKAPVRRK